MRTNLLKKFCLRFPRLAIQLHIGHVKNDSLTIRTRTLDDVPEEMHDTIRQRAQRLNMDVGEYLAYLRLPPEQKLPISEWIKTLEPISPKGSHKIDWVSIVREAREEREAHLHNVLFGNSELTDGD